MKSANYVLKNIISHIMVYPSPIKGEMLIKIGMDHAESVVYSYQHF